MPAPKISVQSIYSLARTVQAYIDGSGNGFPAPRVFEFGPGFALTVSSVDGIPSLKLTVDITADEHGNLPGGELHAVATPDPADAPSSAGFLSGAWAHLLNTATTAVNAGTLVLRGVLGNVRAAWYETNQGTGDKALVGAQRCSKDEVAVGFKSFDGTQDLEGLSIREDVIRVGDENSGLGVALRCREASQPVPDAGFEFYDGANRLYRIANEDSTSALRSFLDMHVVTSDDSKIRIAIGTGIKVTYSVAGFAFYGNAPVGQGAIVTLDAGFAGIDNSHTETIYAVNDDLISVCERLNSLITYLQLRGDLATPV